MIVRVTWRPAAGLAVWAALQDNLAELSDSMPEVLHVVGLSRDPTSAELTVDEGGRSQVVNLQAFGPFPNYSGDADKSWDLQPGWVDLRQQSPVPLWLSRTRDTHWFTYVKEQQLLYCQVNEIQERGERFEDFFSRALAEADSMGARRFVLDLRLDGGGNGYFNRAIVRALVRSRFDEPGRLFVITGRRTFSAAQMLISQLENWTNPIFVGEPSMSRGNHYGDSRRLVLPSSKLSVRASSLYWQYWDPRDTRAWIVPDLAAPLTVDSYRAGRDPALETIAHYVPSPPFADRLTPLLLTADSARAWAVVDQFRHDPITAWQDPAKSLTALSDALRADGKTQAADLAERLRSRLSAWRLP